MIKNFADSIIARNAFNVIDILPDYYYRPDGKLQPLDTYYYTDNYYLIRPNTTYYAYGKTSSSQNFIRISIIVCFYDFNKTFISQAYNKNTYTSPNNAYFIRFSVLKQYKDVIFTEQEDSPNSFIPFSYVFGTAIEQDITAIEQDITAIEQDITAIEQDITAIEQDITAIEQDITAIEQDITNKSSVLTETQIKEEIAPKEIIKTYFKFGTEAFIGQKTSDTGPYDSWDYYIFEVSLGEKYYIKACAGQFARLWQLQDENNIILDISLDSSSVSLKEDIVQINSSAVKYLIVNHRNDTSSGGPAPEVKKLVPNYFVNSDKILGFNSSSNILYNKTLCCCGDSITEGADMDTEGIAQTSLITVYKWNNSRQTWLEQTSNFIKAYGYQIAERNNMTFYQGGVSGSTMQGLTNKSGFSLADGRYTKLPDEIDYLTIWFGWNDSAYGTLGALTDTTNESYYGGYNVVLPYLIDKYPYTKICLIVPFGATAGHREAIRQLGNKWGLAVFDMYQGGTPLYFGKETSAGVEASIVTSNKAKFQANGAHPNYKGHRQISNMLEHFLRGI